MALLPGAGLQAEIIDVELAATAPPAVTVRFWDANGTPLTPDHLEGYGFTIAQIELDEETDLTRYQSLLVREVEGAPYRAGGAEQEPALTTTTQAFADSGGEWAAVADGAYLYTFANQLTTAPVDDWTTTVALYAYRDGRASVVNTMMTFVPDGDEPDITRDITATAACNACHDQLAFHGGTRQEVGLCVTCHTDQTIDPETGNSMEFQVLIHRVHTGAELPSVVAGTPYQVVGFRQSLHDYSNSVWPQDVRNCTTCHAGGVDSDNYKTMPQTAACTACHDDVNLLTGDNHGGGARTDGSCDLCHEPEGDEFDAAVASAHVLPTESLQVRGVNLEILGVEGVEAGAAPVIRFRVTTNAGEPLAPEEMDYLAVTIAGPTSDYLERITETIFRSGSETPPAVEEAEEGAYLYTMQFTVPEDGASTYAVGLEGYVNEVLEGLDGPVRIAGFNPVVYVALGGGMASERRAVVDQNLCNVCHNELALHGTIRQNVDYCVLCHNPTATDEAQRPEEALPPQTINFGMLVHGIHVGAERNSDEYIVYGFNGSIHDYTNVGYPGTLSKCETCHLEGSYSLPLSSGVQPATITQDGALVETIPPVQGLCNACHDSTPAAGHAELQTTSSGIETCAVCHATGREADVTAAHD